LHVIVSGGSGLIGSALIPFLRARGCRVTILVRRPVSGGEDAIRWDPYRREIDSSAFAACDAVICLSGENVSSGRWSSTRRERHWSSRVTPVRFLAETVAELSLRPRVFLCASGSAAYGDAGDKTFAEDGPPGNGFMFELVRAWEAATEPASTAGIRTINMRIGIVLSPRGGMLAQLLPAFRWGVGAAIGPGTQYVGWLTIDDLVAAIHHTLVTESVCGPVNFVSPQPVTQRDFAKTLGRVLHRPVLFTLPPWVLGLIVSKEIAESAVMSQRMLPGKLTASGFPFQHPDLETALRHLLLKSAERGL
jgi:uncharacterized protein